MHCTPSQLSPCHRYASARPQPRHDPLPPPTTLPPTTHYPPPGPHAKPPPHIAQAGAAVSHAASLATIAFAFSPGGGAAPQGSYSARLVNFTFYPPPAVSNISRDLVPLTGGALIRVAGSGLLGANSSVNTSVVCRMGRASTVATMESDK